MNDDPAIFENGRSPIPGTPPFMPTQQSAQDYLAQLLQHQQNTTGMTQVGTQVPQHQVPGPKPFEEKPLQPERAYGPGQGGARQRASMRNFATSVSNLVGQVSQKLQERKQREQQKIFDNFASYSKGMQDAQAQMEEAKELIKKGSAQKDTPEGKQMIEQGTKMMQQAQQSYQQNVTNLNDLTTGKNEKNAKILAKGYGVDDKNANTPERKAAIDAIKKQNPGMNDASANLMSRMPSTQQLSPEAQRQAMLKQAGVEGRPATQGQILKAYSDSANRAMKAGVDEAKISLQAYKQGLMPELQQDGTFQFRPMTQAERGEYQLAQKGVLAWTLKDGKPVAALRNPSTNQIIPGTENPDMLPPAYLTERLHEGEFTFTDKDGNVFRVPTVSVSKPVIPGMDAGGKHGSSAPQKPKGLLTPGNIDIHNRPIVKNADGTISTVRSMSFKEGGKEILVPTVSEDGRIMSNNEAIDQYHKTGKHLGIFDNATNATAYSKSLHEQQDREYNRTPRGTAKPSTGSTGTQPNSTSGMPKGAKLIGQGKDFVSDEVRKAAAQSLVDGTGDLRQLASLRGNEREKLLAEAKKIDPNFSLSNFELRKKTNEAFTTGKQGDQIQSFNTFIGHAGELDEEISKLRNYDTSIANKPINWLKKNITGNPQIAAYMSVQEATRKEFETFLNNNHALHESDKAEGQKILNEDQSPAAQEAAVKSFMALALKRMEALNQRYKTVIGHDFPNMVEPDSVPILERLGYGKEAHKYGSGGMVTSGGNVSDDEILKKLKQLK